MLGYASAQQRPMRTERMYAGESVRILALTNLTIPHSRPAHVQSREGQVFIFASPSCESDRLSVQFDYTEK